MGIKAIMGTGFGTLSLRKTTSTNPFEHNSFKGKAFCGSALPFTDVFQSIKPIEQKPNKLKVISASVVTAVSTFKSKLMQPIVNFANNVKTTWNNGIEAVKSAGNNIAEMGRNVQNRISSVFEHHKVAEENKDIPKILSMKQINEKASTKDLKATWLAENELMLSKESEEIGKAAA
ncbi:MAG: hypothetical protein NC200_06595 [Candidatus Gastranaerophilales bacterium]|nr:hypothetical protein [Candidatus Gastranaerophilales bacterium]